MLQLPVLPQLGYYRKPFFSLAWFCSRTKEGKPKTKHILLHNARAMNTVIHKRAKMLMRPDMYHILGNYLVRQDSQGFILVIDESSGTLKKTKEAFQCV